VRSRNRWYALLTRKSPVVENNAWCRTRSRLNRNACKSRNYRRKKNRRRYRLVPSRMSQKPMESVESYKLAMRSRCPDQTAIRWRQTSAHHRLRVSHRRWVSSGKLKTSGSDAVMVGGVLWRPTVGTRRIAPDANANGELLDA
jgi:hypothetical protein